MANSNLKSISLLCASLFVVLTPLCCALWIYQCVMFYEPNADELGYRDTRLWILIVQTIGWGISFIGSIILIRGIKLERHDLFVIFLHTINCLYVSCAVRALYGVFIHIRKRLQADEVAAKFAIDIAPVAIGVILVIPIYRLYNIYRIQRLYSAPECYALTRSEPHNTNCEL